MSKALVLGAAALVFSAAGASAQVYTTPDYGYAEPVADLAPADGYAAPAAPPVYTAPPVYAAPVYTPPAVYVVPAPVYTAPVVSGYYAAPVVSGYYAAPRGFAANICLRARVLGWLRAWLARLRPPVWVALTPLRGARRRQMKMVGAKKKVDRS